MDIGSINAALSSLKALMDIGQAMRDLKADANIQAKVIELQNQILATQDYLYKAQSEQFDLRKKLSDSEAELTSLHARDAEMKRYGLVEPSAGVFVYVLKDEFRGEEPIHWLCPTCYDKKTKSILQCTFESDATKLYECQNCGGKIAVENRNRSPHRWTPEPQPWYSR